MAARRILVWGGVGVSLGILAWLILGHDLKQFLRVIERVDTRFVLAAFFCSLASYVAMGLALWQILSLLGYRRSFFEVLGISFVSNTANYLVSSAGISGFALKAHLLHKRQVPYGATVLSSVLSTALIYFVLAVIIGQGFLYFFLRLGGTKIAVMEGALGLGVLAVTSVPILFFLFHHRFRGKISRWIFHAMDFVVYSFSRKEIPKEEFEEFEDQLGEGIALIRRERAQLARAIGYTCLDWLLAILVLYFGFRAVGHRLSVAHLSTAFAVGQAATLIPFLPGGLGAMEGVMIATLNQWGVVWENALVAVLIYRLAYHLLPGIGSIFIFWGLKVSEPGLIEETVLDTLPDELQRQADRLQHQRRRKEEPL